MRLSITSISRKIIFFLICFFIIALHSPVSASEKFKIELFFDKKIGRYVEVAEGEILVKFKEQFLSNKSTGLLSLKGLKMLRTLPGNIILFKKEKNDANKNASVEQLIAAYEKDLSIDYVEPNYIVHAKTIVPNDPSFSLQWGIPKVKANLVWDMSNNSDSVVIAIIDTGISLDHEDLVEMIWHNSKEDSAANRNNGIDDDNNGFIDDYQGWNFVSKNNNPKDAAGHGTHVAGIAAAAANNSNGIAGIAWNSKIMAIKVLNDNGIGTDGDIIDGIRYAADNGAKIINLSFGQLSSSDSLDEAVQYAYNKGCIIVAAAGNDGVSNFEYPASFNNVISVASTDKNNQRSSFSNFNNMVDVCAPGGDGEPSDRGDIYSCVPGNSYGYRNGTSMSVPLVSGLAALHLYKNPSWTNTQVVNQIINTADDLGTAGRDDYFGFGKINVARALDQLKPAINLISLDGGEHVKGGTAKNISWAAASPTEEGSGISANGISIYYSKDGGQTYPFIIASGIANSGSYLWEAPKIDLSTLKIRITASDTLGNIATKESQSNFSIDSTAPQSPMVNSPVISSNIASFEVSGEKSLDSAKIFINGSDSGVIYPTASSWKKNVSLAEGENAFTILAQDLAGNESNPVSVKIILKAFAYNDPVTESSVTIPIGSSPQVPIITPEAYTKAEILTTSPPARNLIGTAVDFKSNVLIFIVPITITMKFPPQAIYPLPFYWDETSKSWSDSGINVTSKTSSTITFTTTHLSVYAIFDISGLISDIAVYPNPFKIGSSAGIIFDGLKGDETIYIYSISGELIFSYKAQGESKWIWNAINASGSQAAQNICLFLIVNGSGQKRVGRLAIIN